jgi:hypothetical protein
MVKVGERNNMAEYITDSALLQQLNSDEYVSDPALLAELEGVPLSEITKRQDKGFVDKYLNTPLVQETSQDLANWWTSINQPNAPEPFDLGTAAKRVGTSTAFGAGVGSVFPVIGTGVGAASGFASGVAEEIARNAGASDLARFGASAVVGEIPALAGPAARATANVLSPVNYRAGRAARIFESDRLKNLALDQTRLNYFGKPAFDLNITPTNADDFQTSVKDALGIASDKKASAVVREQLYKDVEKLRMGGTTATPVGTKTFNTGFVTSPEHKELITELERLAKSNEMTSAEKKALNNILKLEVSKDPVDQARFTDYLTNYIQNGGAFQVSSIDGKPQISQKINEKMQAVLRDKFDAYLERNLGEKAFSNLKSLERQEFQAEALDLIPAFIKSKGTLDPKDYQKIISNVKNSPTVRQDFSKALMQHLSDPKFDTSDKLLKEFRKYNKDLVDLGIFDRKQIQEFYTKLNNFDKKVNDKVKVDFIMSTILTPATSTAGAETSGQVFRNPLIPPQSRIPQFGL